MIVVRFSIILYISLCFNFTYTYRCEAVGLGIWDFDLTAYLVDNFW
jgi:hypothetical protein